MIDHTCPFTLGELMAMWAAMTRSPAAGVPRLQDKLQSHIEDHHAHDIQEQP